MRSWRKISSQLWWNWFGQSILSIWQSSGDQVRWYGFQQDVILHVGFAVLREACWGGVSWRAVCLAACRPAIGCRLLSGAGRKGEGTRTQRRDGEQAGRAGLSHCMCLRGSQKQSRAREQRWSHTHQHRITQPWWVDLGGGRRLERGSVLSPPLAQPWRPTKFFILCLRVSGSKLSELLLSCARHSVQWENLGVPYLVKPENPLWKTCAAHLHFHSEGRQMFGVLLYILGGLCVCSFCVLKRCSVCDRNPGFIFSGEVGL